MTVCQILKIIQNGSTENKIKQTEPKQKNKKTVIKKIIFLNSIANTPNFGFAL